MKNSVALLVLSLCLLFCMPVQAEDAAGQSPLNWEISVLPKPTPEQIEQERWVFVFANEIGIYTFDHTSMQLDSQDKNQVHVLIKTIFTDPKVITRLNEKYKTMLKEGETVLSSELQMVLDLKGKSYTVTETRVYSKQGSLLEERKQPGKSAPILSNSFADAMYKIAQNYIREHR